MDGEITISVRELDASVERAYRTLFPGDPDKSPKLLHWRSRTNPHGPSRFVVASRGSEVVGMIALIPTRLRNVSGNGLAYQAVDTAVHPSCQGQGLFSKMGRIAQDVEQTGGEILWGFPNANAAPGWYGRLGWTNFGAVPLLMRPLRTSFLFGRMHSALRAIDLPLTGRPRSSPKVYDDGVELGRACEALWNEVAGTLAITLDRTGDWMRWRLFDKPGADYRCVGLKSGEDLEAFVATKVADKHGGRLCYVMEALAAPEGMKRLTALLRAELSLASREGAEVALAWCPKYAPNYPAYRRAGFWPVPSRMRPIEINFGARALLPDAKTVTVPGARWYISFLDSDTN